MAALAAAAVLSLALATARASAEPVELRVAQIERFSIASARLGDRAGRLAFRGGLELSGPRHFGGLSGLIVAGDRLTAVTDDGHWFLARMTIADGRLVGLSQTVLTARRGLDGEPITRKRYGDAEALAVHHSDVLVAVERPRHLLAYPAQGIVPDLTATPRRIGLSANADRELKRRGFEGLAALPDGALILFSEGQGREGPHYALRLPGGEVAVARRGPWAITGADALPGGDLVIAERRSSGGLDVGFRIRRLGADAVRRGDGPIDGPVLLEADLGEEIDNMEAIAATEEDGETILTVLSDDNFRFFQRTLFLRFAIVEPRPRPARPAD